MKNKYIDSIFFGILLCLLISLSFLGPSLASKMVTTEKISLESTTFVEKHEVLNLTLNFEEADKMTQQEKNIIARESHEKFSKLVDAMLNLRSKGFLSYYDILRIHKSLENYQPNISTEVPYSDKDLLEYLYDNSIITKAQYDQILDIIDKHNQ